MLPYPDIDPNIFEIGPIKVRWYGLMYALAFLCSYLLILFQKKARRLGLHGGTLQDLIFFLAVGVIAGARFGYIFFYQFSNLGAYLKNPLEIIAVWHGLPVMVNPFSVMPDAHKDMFHVLITAFHCFTNPVFHLRAFFQYLFHQTFKL